MSIKEETNQELTSLLMIEDLSILSIEEIEDAICVVSSEVSKLKSELNDVQATQLFYINHMSSAKEAHNDGELSFNYNKLMQEEKNVFEIESAISDCERLIDELTSTLEDKKIDMPKPRM